MALHCLRDAVDVKPDLMVSTAEKIVEKVSFVFIFKKTNNFSVPPNQGR